MNAATLIEKVTTLTEQHARILDYLGQCRVVTVYESETRVPPTGPETTALIRHLKSRGANPLVVGSVGVLSYLQASSVQGFRPTVDLDLWVDRLPAAMPEGWTTDPEAIGVPSWVSPSGGYVDFLLPDLELPNGVRTPKALAANPESLGTDFPVASWLSLLKLKLNSVREKDLADVIALVRAQGRAPTLTELGPLSRVQRENYDLMVQWFQLRPTGAYGT